MLLWAVLLLAPFAFAADKEYSITLDPLDKFNVTWSSNGTSSTSAITFTITCQTTGWVGLGFSPNGAMTGADIIVGWVTSDGTPHLLDMHAEANGVPVKDTSSNVHLISATESNGITTIKFNRSLNTCDKTQDNVITPSTVRLIYAYKDTDPTGDVVESSDYHGTSTRGVRSVYLLEPKTTIPATPNDALTYDMTVSNYSVPAADTTYYCQFFEPPAVVNKHHIISAATLVTPGNEALVHHILLYGCWGVTQEQIQNNTKTGGECFSDEMPDFAGSCRSVFFAWAIGGGDFYYPEVAGAPLGGSDGAAPNYYQMEVHYDNPSLLSTWKDSSGLRITYTPTLRANDVGFVELGAVNGLAVPPQPDKFKAVAYCDSSCTNQWIPAEGIKVFNYMLHSHLLGVAVRVDWFRDGKHLGVLAKDDNYDFNFQENRNFEEIKTLLPGDSMKVTCTYSDPNRNTVTYGGLASKEEMCLAFLSYYPRQNISNCESISSLQTNPNDAVYTSLSLDASVPGRSYANIQVLSEVTDWSESAVAAMQKSFNESNQLSRCIASGGVDFPTSYQTITASDYVVKEEVVKDVCEKPDEPTTPATASQNVISFFFLLLTFLAANIM